MKTIGQILHNKDYSFEILDSNDNLIYGEDLDGFWVKYKYDSDGDEIYYEASSGDIEDRRE